MDRFLFLLNKINNNNNNNSILLLGRWLHNYTSLRFNFWANGSNMAVVVASSEPQLRNRTR